MGAKSGFIICSLIGTLSSGVQIIRNLTKN
jgi:hypothetical protein